ncbi:MAG TPA: hypothetical protein VK590_05475 [Saprospiraceae bacterium]|nr:hypothetical protein [Saprospiraceae bacterium]
MEVTKNIDIDRNKLIKRQAKEGFYPVINDDDSIIGWTTRKNKEEDIISELIRLSEKLDKIIERMKKNDK